MFNDTDEPGYMINAQRTSWVYKYSGHQLLRGVKGKLEYFNTVYEAVHNELVYTLNQKSADEAKINQLREQCQKYSKEVEQCMIYHHEFARNPSVEYSLGLGDVLYFEMYKTEHS